MNHCMEGNINWDWKTIYGVYNIEHNLSLLTITKMLFFLRPRSSGLVPNTNKHAVEANPVWMTDSAYNNMTFQEDNDGGKF